jgi:hypothetical protein
MPQIQKSKRQPLLDGKVAITEKGDLCYLITVRVIIPAWAAKAGWTTASELRRLLVQDPDLAKLKSVCRGSPFADAEILNQAAMAYHEFYRRVVSNYEDHKARANGDVFAGLVYSKSHLLGKE